jgi:hypothetical protein
MLLLNENQGTSARNHCKSGAKKDSSAKEIYIFDGE